MSQPEDEVPPVPPMPHLPPLPRQGGSAIPARMPSERATHLSSLRSLSGQAARPPRPPAAAPYQPPPPPPTLPPSATSRYLRPQDLRRFENFQFAAKMVVEGFYSGRHRSPFHDRSAEFSDYRPYVAGDEIRSLDWRAYARTDRDYVKLFRKETDMRCHVLLDTSRSMAFRDEAALIAQTTPRPSLFDRLRRRSARPNADAPPPTALLSKFEYGAYLTAGLCYLMVQQGDKASLALGASALNTFVPPGGTITHLHGLLSHLERTQPDGETAIANAVRGLFTLTRRRGLLVVISDFLEEPDPLFDALAMYTYRGWQILLLHVLTETELNLPGNGPQHYLDAETSGHLDADPDSLRAAYQSELHDWLQGLETQAKARGIHYSRMTTATPYDQALERYLTARQ